MSSKGKHMTLSDRAVIETGINSGSDKSSIAKTIGKSKSAVGKEIAAHREASYRCSLPLECANYRRCTYGRACSRSCPLYEEFRCRRRDRSPGACNGCGSYSSCRFTKYRYCASKADAEYRSCLAGSREGVNLTEEEGKELGDLIAPMVKRGLSVYQIKQIEKDRIKVSERTIYSYIEGRVFSGSGLLPISLRQQPGRKMTRKEAAGYKKRADRKHLRGRTNAEFEEYMRENPEAYVTQMDTVYNDATNGPFIQTFKIIGLGLLIGLYHDFKTAEAMAEGIETLYRILGDRLFRKYCEVIKTDRGSEFVMADEAETAPDGTRRCHVFYCDPMASGQKGSLENIHKEIRYSCPKKKDLRAIGLVSQAALNKAVSSIDSGPKKKLRGKSPLELTRYIDEELADRLEAFGIAFVQPDEINLTPEVLAEFADK